MQGLRHIKFYKKNGYSFVNTNTNTNTNTNDSVNIGQIDDTSDNENDKADANVKGFDFIDDD
jgi:hypothetical protein